MKIKYIKKYLNYLGVKSIEKPKIKKCEICNSSNTKEIRKKISWNNKKYGILPVHCCCNCGFLFQNPRYSKNFYNNYYAKVYRDITLKTQIPSKKYLQDQRKRGKLLYKFLKDMLPSKGSMVDVGSSVGLMLVPFLEKKWKCIGNDPQINYVKYGKKIGLPVEAIQAEDMNLKPNSMDLIIIIGSLEHVYDINKVMNKCKKAIKKNGLLVLEGRGDPLGHSKDYFNHNHHRYFSKNSFELLMIKYGWKPFLTTSYKITGPSRGNSIFCIGRFEGKKGKLNINNLIRMGKRETFEDIFYKFKYFDANYNLKIKSEKKNFR